MPLQSFFPENRSKKIHFDRGVDKGGLIRDITIEYRARPLSDRVQKYLVPRCRDRVPRCSAHKKRDRCWNYSIEVGKSSLHPLLCERCVEAIEGKF